MNRDELRTVDYKGKTFYFHQWITKTFRDENYSCQHIYALIESIDGKIVEAPSVEIKFVSIQEQIQRAFSKTNREQ